MKQIKYLLIIILLLWASPAVAETFTLDCGFPEIDDLPEFSYEIGQVNKNLSPSSKWANLNTLLFTMRLIDWRQTLKIATEYETVYVAKRNAFGDYYMAEEKVHKYKEHNPILGEQPTEQEVNQYFLVMIGLDSLFYYKACNNVKWARFNEKWVKFNTIVTFGCVGNNFRIGINLN